MCEITLRKCKDCGILYPADEKHRCNVLVKKEYQQGRADALEELKKRKLNLKKSVQSKCGKGF